VPSPRGVRDRAEEVTHPLGAHPMMLLILLQAGQGRAREAASDVA